MKMMHEKKNTRKNYEKKETNNMILDAKKVIDYMETE